MNKIFYVAIFHEENNKYWVSFPDFPECFTEGDTLEDAFRYAEEALKLCIDDRIKNHEALPKPSLVDDVKSESGKYVLLSYENQELLKAA